MKLQREGGSTFHARLESIRLDRADRQDSARAGGRNPTIRTAMSDISERVRAEEAAAEAHTWVTNLLESITDAFFSLDCQWRFTYVNREAERVLGMLRDQLIGHNIWEMFPPAVGSRFQWEYERAVADKKTMHFEEFYPPFGVWFEVHAYPSASGLSVYFQDITERKHVEQRLSLLSTAVEASGDAVVVANRQGTITWVNPAFVWLTGYSQAEAVGQNPRILKSGRQSAEFYLRMWQTILTGQVWRGELVNRRKDGSLYSEEMTLTPVRADGVEITHFIAIKQDVTQSKMMAEARKFLSQCGYYQDSSKDFFRSLARYLAQSLEMDFVCIAHRAEDGLTARTVTICLDGKIEDNVTYALKDTPCGQAVGQTICCFPKDVRHLFPKAVNLQEMRAESYLGTTLWSFDEKPIGLIALIGRKPLTTPRLAESLLELVTVRAAGELQRMLAQQALLQAYDNLDLRIKERTTELQQTNEQLRQEIESRRQTEQRLFEAEMRYRTVAEFTYDWEYWKSPEGILLYCSPSCERITGYTPLELTLSPDPLVQMIHPEDQDNWKQHEREAMTEPAPRSIVFRIQRKDGGLRWIEHFCQPVTGSQGQFLGLRASNRDVTERRQAEMDKQQLRAELAHVARAITASQFAASLAHELNQPLTAIRCNAETAQKFLAADPPNFSELRETLQDIAQDSERAGGVIQGLRGLFKKTTDERSVLQINEIIRETIDLARGEFVLKAIVPQVDLEPMLPKVLGNRIELQQVLLNLVVNAVDAMSECEPGLRHLHIATACEGSRDIRVSVRDSGSGIQVQPISRLFEPFFTTKASGMGMGLAISHSIIETHGGSLGATNNPDRGATFHLTLPIHQGEHS